MTLARIQQIGVLCVALAAGICAVLVWRTGHPVLAALAACLPLAAYAAALAFEFGFLRHVHGSDQVDEIAPLAAAGQLTRAWWHEFLAGPRVFCWQQPFCSQRWPDTLPSAARPSTRKRGVLLIHGFVCNRGLWNPWLMRLRAQGTPCVAVNLEPVFGSIDLYVSAIEQGVQQLERSTGMAPVVVAHSMGGLALRRWWADQSDAARIHHAISLGTPHQGTWLARFAMTTNARQMRRHSPWLQSLAQRELASATERWTCFYSHCDNIVFPPACATLAGADNRHLPGVAHVHMVQCPEPWAALQRQLIGPDSISPARSS